MTKVFCLIFRIFNLDKAYPKLDFETKIVQISRKLSKIQYFDILLHKGFEYSHGFDGFGFEA